MLDLSPKTDLSLFVKLAPGSEFLQETNIHTSISTQSVFQMVCQVTTTNCLQVFFSGIVFSLGNMLLCWSVTVDVQHQLLILMGVFIPFCNINLT